MWCLRRWVLCVLYILQGREGIFVRLLIVQFDHMSVQFRGHWVSRMKGPRTHDVKWEGGWGGMELSVGHPCGRVKAQYCTAPAGSL